MGQVLSQWPIPSGSCSQAVLKGCHSCQGSLYEILEVQLTASMEWTILSYPVPTCLLSYTEMGICRSAREKRSSQPQIFFHHHVVGGKSHTGCEKIVKNRHQRHTWSPIWIHLIWSPYSTTPVSNHPSFSHLWCAFVLDSSKQSTHLEWEWNIYCPSPPGPQAEWSYTLVYPWGTECSD